MNALMHLKYFLWSFGRFKVPLIGHLRSKLVSFDDKKVVIKIPLRRRSKNHLNSMYFGALAVGADLAGGLHSFYFADKNKLNTSIVFKSFQAQFLRRPESDVHFVCEMGLEVAAMLEESKKTGERINKPLIIKAYTQYPAQPVEVANFILELSIKVIQ